MPEPTRQDWQQFLAYLDKIEAFQRNRATAQAIVAHMERSESLRIYEVEPCITEDSPGLRLEAGFDERGTWHAPKAAVLDNRQHGTGVIRAVFLALLLWLVGYGAVRLVLHFAPMIDHWRLPW
jgi:hypothetical protein